MSASEWAFVTIAWIFGFLPGWWFGSQWVEGSTDQDGDTGFIAVDRGRICRPDEDAW